jgi:hypothetical protein
MATSATLVKTTTKTIARSSMGSKELAQRIVGEDEACTRTFTASVVSPEASVAVRILGERDHLVPFKVVCGSKDETVVVLTVPCIAA